AGVLSTDVIEKRLEPHCGCEGRPAQRLGRQQWRTVAIPRQVFRCRASAEQSRQPLPARYRQRNPVSAPAHRVNDPWVVALAPDGWERVGGVADQPGPAASDAQPGLGGERCSQLAHDAIEGRDGAVRLLGPTGPAVARQPAAEDDPVVRGQPEVVEKATRVEDSLAAGPAEELASVLIKWLRDHRLTMHRPQTPP